MMSLVYIDFEMLSAHWNIKSDRWIVVYLSEVKSGLCIKNYMWALYVQIIQGENVESDED